MKVSLLSVEAIMASAFLVSSIRGSSVDVEPVKDPEKDGYLPIVVSLCEVCVSLQREGFLRGTPSGCSMLTCLSLFLSLVQMEDRNDASHRSLWKEIPDTPCCDDVPANSIKYIAEPGCNGGFLCYNGPVQYVSCPKFGDIQMLYDESVGNCNWPHAVQCVSSCPSDNDTPTPPPTLPPIAPPTCPVGFDNLGPQLSASDFKGDFATLAESIDYLSPNGRESQVSLLVGGSYNGPLAAEIEGRIVVLGDFKIGRNGVNSLGKFVLVVLFCFVTEHK